MGKGLPGDADEAGDRYPGRMEILQSRLLLRPRDLRRTVDFYDRVLGLHRYREFGSEESGGVVFFLGGGFLEVSGSGDEPASDLTQLWLQVRSVDETHETLGAQGVPVDEPPATKPWGLREMRARDPDGLLLIFVEVPRDHPLRRDLRGG
ncbi:MAG: VOC family protein [Myxococcota bacterium]